MMVAAGVIGKRRVHNKLAELSMIKSKRLVDSTF
jgi:hypothetical protein